MHGATPAEATDHGYRSGCPPQPYVDFATTADGGLVIERGGFGGRPAWVRRERGFALASTDLGWLVDTSRGLGLPLTLDSAELAAECVLEAGPSGRAASLYREIAEVPPGVRARVHADRVMFEALALPQVAEERAPRELVERLRARLSAALDRAASGVSHLAVLTGGGVDSGALLALAQSRAVRADALAISFASEGDDRPHLETLARALVLTPFRVSPGDPELPCDLTAAALPFTWPSGALEALLMTRAREAGASKVLAGLGADELFDGDRESAALWPLLRQRVPWSVRRLARKRSRARVPSWAGPRARRVLVSAHDRALAARPWIERSGEERLRAAFADPHLARASTLRVQLEALSGVVRIDPYLDAELAAFVLSLPPRALLGSGAHPVTRGLFREALAGVLPDSVRLRADKASFAPVHRALFEAPRRATLAGLASVPRLADLGIIEPLAFRRAFDATAAGGEIDARLYAVLAVEGFLGGW